MRQICLDLVSRNLQEFCLLGEFHLFTTCILNVFSQFCTTQKICHSLLHCSCSLHQTLHSSEAFLLNPPRVCNIFPKGRPSLLNPIDSRGHICCMHPLEWIIFSICWNLSNGFNCFQQLVQPDSEATVKRCRARGNCRNICEEWGIPTEKKARLLQKMILLS